jgi:hypothetical protein
MFSNQNFVTIQLYARSQYLLPIPVSVILTPKETFVSTSSSASQKICSISSHLIQIHVHSRSTFSRATLISVLCNVECNLFISGIFSNSDCATLKRKRLTLATYLRPLFGAKAQSLPPLRVSARLPWVRYRKLLMKMCREIPNLVKNRQIISGYLYEYLNKSP